MHAIYDVLITQQHICDLILNIPPVDSTQFTKCAILIGRQVTPCCPTSSWMRLLRSWPRRWSSTVNSPTLPSFLPLQIYCFISISFRFTEFSFSSSLPSARQRCLCTASSHIDLCFCVLLGATPAFKLPPSSAAAAAPSPSGPIEKTFDTIQGVLNEEVVKSTQGIYQFDLSGNSRRCLVVLCVCLGVCVQCISKF